MTGALDRVATDRGTDEPIAAELWRMITAGFLQLVRWSAERRVMAFPVDHPLLGTKRCVVVGCGIKAGKHQLCAGCTLRWRAAGEPAVSEFASKQRPPMLDEYGWCVVASASVHGSRATPRCASPTTINAPAC
ncbi:hypothetical protein [Nocardia asiatica]|uniref:hypothetical protein n=1 Tax=Nocardia asiatica TaxID=209252 RepID=UPI003EE23080